MGTLLQVSTIILDATGFLFSAVFIIINIFCNFTDMPNRNETILKISKATMISSLVFAFLTILLSKTDYIDEAIEKSSFLFSIISITWAVVIIVTGALMLFSVVSKKFFKPTVVKNIRRLFPIAIPGAVIGLILTWIFS